MTKRESQLIKENEELRILLAEAEEQKNRLEVLYRISPSGIISVNRDVSDHRWGEEEIKSLAKFPSENPNPVLRISLEGNIMYVNEAGQSMMQDWNAIVGSPVPEEIRRKVNGKLAEKTANFELDLHDRVYSFSAVSIAEEGYINLYGLDVTERKRAEKALQISEERYRDMLSALIEGFCIIEVVFDADCKPVDYRFLETNALFEAQTGLYGAKGKFMREMVPEHEERWYEIYGRIAATGEPLHFENEAKELNRWFEIRAVRVGGNNSHKVAIGFNDITMRKQMELALQESEEKYASIYNNSPVAISLTNMPEATIATVNDAYLKLFGYMREDVIGKTSLELNITDAASEALVAEKLQKQGSVQDFECSGNSKDGALYNLLLQLNWITISGRKFILTMAIDITQRRKMEKAILEKEKEKAMLARILELASQPFGIGFPDGRMGLVNSAFETLTGYNKKELSNVQWNKMLTPPEYFEMERHILDELVKTGNPVRYEKEYIRKDGIRVPIELLVHLMKDPEGHPEYYFAFLNDITERRKNELNLHKLIRTLKAMQKSSQMMTQARDEKTFLEDVCRVIVEDCGHKMVWIGYKQNDRRKSIKPVAFAGFEENYLETLKLTWADTSRGRGPTGTTIRNGKPTLCRNMHTDPAFIPWREEALKRGYSSSIVLPLFMDDEVFGVVNIYSKETDPFTEAEQQLLSKLADDLASGIKAIRLNLALKKAKESLEVTVEQRTSLLYKTMNDLESEKQRVLDVLNMIPAFVALITFDYRIAYSNQIFKKFFGDPGFNKCYEHLFGRTEICEDCMIKEVLDTRGPCTKEWIGPDGHIYQKSHFPFTDNDGSSFVLAMGIDITEKKNTEKMVLTKILETEERDRKRFASDLHDDLGPTLSAIKLQMSLIPAVKTDSERSELLDICDQLLLESIEKMRILSNNIMPRLIENYGLETAVRSFIHRMENTTKLKFKFHSNLVDHRFNEETELHLYRIVTELINNTIKHSGATEVLMDMSLTDHELNIVYSDNGKGYNPQKTPSMTSGIGLQNIINRVSFIDGSINFTKRGGKTVVTISKPLSD